MDVTLTAALHCHSVVIELFSSLFPSRALWRQEMCGSSSANKTCDGERQRTCQWHANRHASSHEPTHRFGQDKLNHVGVTAWQAERQKCFSDQGSDKDWVTAYEWRQTHKRGRKAEARKNDRELGENEWAQCDKHTSSKSDNFRGILAANDLLGFLHKKRPNMTRDRPGNCFHTWRANAYSSAMKNSLEVWEE